MGSYALSQQAQKGLQAYKNQMSQLNGGVDTSSRFSVTPAVEKTVIQKYKENADLLGLINVIGVNEQMGEKLHLGAGGTIASTTDTRIQPRRPKAVGELESEDDYVCTQTNYDVAYRWPLIDNWAGQSNFMQMLSDVAIKQVAQDKQRIGFHGKFRSKSSNPTLYPNLEDVNVGWLEKIRHYSPERYKETVDVGSTSDYKSLDHLVESLLDGFISDEHRDDADLVVICGRTLLNDKYHPLLNQDLAPSEQQAVRGLMANKQLGSLNPFLANFFPSDSLLITSMDNLSIYIQEGSMRRHLKDEPEWDRTSDYQSMNECFVVEDYSKCALVDNIVIK